MGAGRAFPASARLTRKCDFDAAFAAPTVRLRSPPLRLLAKPNDKGFARLGVVAPKRALRRAVDRNRVKRRVRESFRLARSRLPPSDFVITVDGRHNVREAADELWAKLSER